MSLSVNSTLKIVVALLSAAVIALMALQAQSSWKRWQSADMIYNVASVSKSMFTAMHNLRVDRASTVRALVSEKALDGVPKVLVTTRGEEVPALKDALAALDSLGTILNADDAKALRATAERHFKLQEESVTLFKKPKSERRADFSDEFWRNGTELLTLLDKISGHLAGTIKLADAYVDQLMTIKQLVWDTRNSAGDSSVIVNNTLSGLPLPKDALNTYNFNLAKVDALWSMIEDATGKMSVPPRLAQAVAEAKQKYFDPAFLDKRTALLKQLIAGEKPEVTGESWTATTVARLGAVLNVASVALEVAEEHALQQHSLGQRDFFIALGLLILAVAFAVAASILVSRRVTGPLQQINAAMNRLADGDFDVALPGLARKDEIGGVANAVERFKVLATERARAETEQMIKRQQEEADRQAARAKAELAARDELVAVQQKQAAAQAEVQAQLAEEQRKAAEEQDKSAKIQSRAVKSISSGLMILSKGDLTHRLDEGDFTSVNIAVCRSYNQTTDRLQSAMNDIAAITNEAAEAASQIAAGVHEMSTETEQQAARLEETAASMEEISATVRKNAENARHANELASGTRDVAGRGGQVVSQAVEAMSRIEESSRKISDIISVIDEIARQTNLLALNAAVEAARAGDAGRGFAVVASEVRSLAQRSSQAAKDIKDLIGNSSGQVRDGVDLVNRAGQSLGDIVSSIKDVAELIADIATASAEQSVGLEQVSKAISQMDEMTQRSAALVEENASAARSLQDQTAQVAQRIGEFKIAADSGKDAAASRAA